MVLVVLLLPISFELEYLLSLSQCLDGPIYILELEQRNKDERNCYQGSRYILVGIYNSCHCIKCALIILLTYTII